MSDQREHKPTWRKPAGILLILLMIASWAVLIASIAPMLGGLHWLIHAFYYLAAGIAWLWVLPLRPLLLWMETGKWRARDLPPG